jgi:hypothetical protein
MGGWDQEDHSTRPTQVKKQDPITKNKMTRPKMARDLAQAVACLPSKCNALSLDPALQKNKNRVYACKMMMQMKETDRAKEVDQRKAWTGAAESSTGGRWEQNQDSASKKEEESADGLQLHICLTWHLLILGRNFTKKGNMRKEMNHHSSLTRSSASCKQQSHNVHSCCWLTQTLGVWGKGREEVMCSKRVEFSMRKQLQMPKVDKNKK